MKEEIKLPTLCWSCRNAVPKMVNGKYIRGCSWSIHLESVEGWTAEKSIKKPCSDDPTETWNVQDCPEYEEDCPDDAICNQDCDDGYVKLASAVLKKQMQSYESALKQYAETGDRKYLHRVKSMEHEMLSPHYSALTLEMVDFKQYIIGKRKKYGVALGV